MDRTTADCFTTSNYGRSRRHLDILCFFMVIFFFCFFFCFATQTTPEKNNKPTTEEKKGKEKNL